MMRAYVMLCAVLTMSAGCGDWFDDITPKLEVYSGRDSVKAKVGPAGAELALESGVRVSIPKDALKEEIEITVSEVADDKVKDLPQVDESREVQKPVKLEPHGTKFEKAVEITLPVPDMYRDTPEKELSVVVLDDEKDADWGEVMTADDPVKGGRAKVESDHFSFYAIVPRARSTGGSDGDAGTGEGTRDGGGNVTLPLGDITGMWASNTNCPGTSGFVVWEITREGDLYTIGAEGSYTALLTDRMLGVTGEGTTGTLTFSDDDHFEGSFQVGGRPCQHVGRRAPGLAWNASLAVVQCAPPDSTNVPDCDALCTGLTDAACAQGPASVADCSCPAQVELCASEMAVWQDCVDRQSSEIAYACTGSGEAWPTVCEPEWYFCVRPCNPDGGAGQPSVDAGAMAQPDGGAVAAPDAGL
jgi:hypothetical protein